MNPLAPTLNLFRVSIAVFGLASVGCSISEAATSLIRFEFDTNGANIDEPGVGWDGTEPGGSTLALTPNVSLSQNLRSLGSFTDHPGGDAFHVDNWHSQSRAVAITNGDMVSFSIQADAGFFLNLGDGDGQFQTLLHTHAQLNDVNEIFDRVALFINGVDLGDQTYVHLAPPSNIPPLPQTLTWAIGTNLSLQGLTSANVQLYFYDSTGGSLEPGDNQRGPGWHAADGAFMQLNGNVVPEPSGAVLGLVGLSLGFLRRRRP